MSLFDSLKNVAMKSAGNFLNDVAANAKREISNEIKEKSVEALSNGVDNYLEQAKDKVTNEEGREAISQLQNLIGDAKQVRETATGLDEDKYNEAMKKTQEDLQELNDFTNKMNN